MPIIDLTRQTNLTVDVGGELAVNGTIDIVQDGLQIGSTAVTTTAAELNKLDGATLSTTELNYVGGVTSSIQTQLNQIVDGTTDFTGNIDIGSTGTPTNLKVWGDLEVVGSGVSFDVSQVQAEDPIMQLNYISNVAQTASDGGIQIGRAAGNDAQLIWDESASRWIFGDIGSSQNIVGPDTTDTLTNKSIDTDNNTITIGTITNQKKVSTNSAVNVAFNALDGAWQDLGVSGEDTKGAHMIGIHDTNTRITATTVEGALDENRGAIDTLEATSWTATAGNGLTGTASGSIGGAVSFSFAVPDGTYTTVGADSFDVDTTALYGNLDDQAMTWTSAQTLNAGAVVPTGQDITLTDQPAVNNDAANKVYVDTQTPNQWFAALANTSGTYSSSSEALFTGKQVASAFHSAGTASDLNQWLVFVNGQVLEKEAITSIANVTTDIVVTVNTSNLGYSLASGDEISLWGPVS